MTVDATLTARGLLLDMDSTLVNSEAVVEFLWQRWAEEHQVPLEDVLAVAHGRQGWATMAHFLPDRPEELNRADNARMLEEETRIVEGVVPIAGAPEFMAAVADLPHALVTSANIALTERRMAAAGLALPSILVTAESVTVSKPDPEGFLKGAAELGLSPQDCLVFEDSQAGIAAAKAAGMRVVGVGPRAAAFTPTAHVADLTHVRVESAPDATIAIHILP
ncbi:HAD-IA family hydrolase [Nocardia sp. CDC160]|uniref:HAD-IA family hydrolase n=1 Tax=Nocardia sp. CDC160 TaxID=3112166 RepID=UPI002DB9C600|nr:HAD-IA family hydrolase [Nocardia sp. CDC160]MEC3917414.1 HAD-IA family hydrolase [Nocardia sp. CDC160]